MSHRRDVQISSRCWVISTGIMFADNILAILQHLLLLKIVIIIQIVSDTATFEHAINTNVIIQNGIIYL